MPAIREHSVPSGSVFAEAQVVAIDDNELTLLFPPSASFHLKLAEDSKHASLAARVLREVLGLQLRIRCQLADAPAAPAEPLRDEAQLARPQVAPIAAPGPDTDAELARSTAAAPPEDAGGIDRPVVTDPVDAFVAQLKDTFDAEEVKSE